MSDTDRRALLADTPERYLAEGFTDPAGAPRPGLLGTAASAACQQLMAAELSSQELAFTVDAIALLLPEHDEPDPGARVAAVVNEALSVVSGAIGQDNNSGLERWLVECARHVRSEADLAAFQAHIEAVRRQYSMLVALLP